jgi:disulfide oxidoreductase YuzD
MKFVHCDDMLNININDVLNNYDGVKKDLEKYNRDKNSELLQSLKEIDITTLTQQIANAVKFVKTVGDDEKTGYLLYILDNIADVGNPKLKSFYLNFLTY